MNRIVIEYPANVTVAGPQTVHVLQDGATLCKRRPMKFTATQGAVTCKECLKNMPSLPEVLVLPPKPVEPPKPKQPKERKPKQKRAFGSRTKRGNGILKGREEIGPDYGKSRTHQLSEKGKRLVEKWEREEKAAQHED